MNDTQLLKDPINLVFQNHTKNQLLRWRENTYIIYDGFINLSFTISGNVLKCCNELLDMSNNLTNV